MNIPATPIDPARCPLCGQANRCALELERAAGAAPSPCWCTQVAFDARLLARVPAPARRLACVCRACAERAA